MHSGNALVPTIGVVTDIRQETPDVKTFRVSAPGGGVCFTHRPGQCAMLSAPGVGEAMFSISSAPVNTEYLEFSIKKCGCLTDFLHEVEAKQQITVRGPYGNAFPVDTALQGQNLLFIAGGIGLAPLRSVVQYVLHHRGRYGEVDIVYGARAREDLVFYSEIQNEWQNTNGVKIYLTIDRAEENWQGHVGFVPDFVRELGFFTNRTALVCGPPVMITYTLQALEALGFKKEQVYTTMEMRMKCGVGKCGRCNIGAKYVCKDGPVFRCDELAALPAEY